MSYEHCEVCENFNDSDEPYSCKVDDYVMYGFNLKDLNRNCPLKEK